MLCLVKYDKYDKIFMFINLKAGYFQLWFLFKIYYISTAGKQMDFSERNTFKPRKNTTHE